MSFYEWLDTYYGISEAEWENRYAGTLHGEAIISEYYEEMRGNRDEQY